MKNLNLSSQAVGARVTFRDGFDRVKTSKGVWKKEITSGDAFYSKEEIDAKGFLTTESDSQLISFDGSNILEISNGNTVDLNIGTIAEFQAAMAAQIGDLSPVDESTNINDLITAFEGA